MRQYHHLGIPTTEVHEGEKFVPHLKIYVWGYDTSDYRIEWVRYGEGAEKLYHPLMMKLPHVAFQVDDLKKELEGKKLIWGPSESLPGFTVAFIEENGAPVELIETKLTEEELLGIVRSREQSYTERDSKIGPGLRESSRGSTIASRSILEI